MDSVDLDLVNAVVHRAQIFVIRRRAHTADVGTEVSLRYTSQTLVEYTVHNASQTAVLVGMDYGNFSVVIAGNEQVFPLFVRGKVAAPHAVDIYLIDKSKVSVRFDGKNRNSFIRNGIKVLAV